MSFHHSNVLRWGVLSLALVLAGCDSEEEDAAESTVRPVRTVVVEAAPGGTVVTLAGTVEAVETVNLSFLHGGRMIERLVGVGDTIAPGQVIARLDTSNEENTLRSAEANLAAAEGQLAEARINFERQRTLYERQIAARAAFRACRTGLCHRHRRRRCGPGAGGDRQPPSRRDGVAGRCRRRGHHGGRRAGRGRRRGPDDRPGVA